METFTRLIGQTQAVELLEQAVIHNRIAPAYLFAGPPGIGKALAARCFSTTLLGMGMPTERQQMSQKRVWEGNHPDLLWVEPTYQHQGQLLSALEATAAGLKRKAPPQIRLEQVREITQFLSRPPLEAARLVVVIEEAQTMAEAAANALLKTLEEPGQATLILIAPSADALLPTLVSRCQRLPFSRLSAQQMQQVLSESGQGEILAHPELLAIAQGSPGEAIAAGEQLQAIPPQLPQKLLQPPQSPRQALELAREVATELDTPAQLWLLDYLQYCYWETWRQVEVVEILEKARRCLLGYVQPRLVWECTLLKLRTVSGTVQLSRAC